VTLKSKLGFTQGHWSLNSVLRVFQGHSLNWQRSIRLLISLPL